MNFFLPLYFLPLFLWGNTRELVLSGCHVHVEIADTEEKRTRGLMFRETLPEGEGMFFVHAEPQILSYWMKNVQIPLSIGFFDEEGILINVEDMSLLSQGEPLRSWKSLLPAKYALEVPSGWFTKHGIEPGMKFSFRDP